MLRAIDKLSEEETGKQTAELIYRTAHQLLNQGKKEEAEAVHKLIYKVWSYRSSIEETRLELARAEVGDAVYFEGQKYLAFPTENVFCYFNGPYYVLEKKENGEMLLEMDLESALQFYSRRLSFSTFAIESSWKDSEIRKWLNTDFLQSFFSEEEQALIMTTTLQNECFTVDGSSIEKCLLPFETFWDRRLELEETEDKIFLPLLSDLYRELENGVGVEKLSSIQEVPAEKYEFMKSVLRETYFRSSGVFDDRQELPDKVKNVEMLLCYDGVVQGTYFRCGHGVDKRDYRNAKAIDRHAGDVLYMGMDSFYIRMWVNPYAESSEENTSF